MPLPRPAAGLVLRYAFLWRAEAAVGRDEAAKDRPCAVILVVRDDADEEVVTVLPITHSPPSDPELAVAVPAETKRRLGLDDDRSWIVLTDANRFVWPGPDLRPRFSGDMSSVAYGLLPRGVMEEVRRKFIAAVRRRRADVLGRSI